MTVTPQGISVQTAYRWFRDGRLVVNRQYQRKLVWTIVEKQRLIDSLLLDYPIPLFLLAEKGAGEGESSFEIIDGLQRLNAIFSFIENDFVWNGACFDVNEFARARQLKASGVFCVMGEEVPRLDPARCANLLDYQLAVTIFPGEHEARITDVFGRINSSGHQLSDQERRQAGVLSSFAETVRQVAAEIRGDVSRDVLMLTEMPEISIETTKNVHGYKLKAEEIFWCYQGILRTNHLRDSEDEQVIADLLASILFGQPVDASGDFLDLLYTEGTEPYEELNRRIVAYPRDALVDQVKYVFSEVRSVIESYSDERFCFRATVYPKPTSNAQKQAFFAVFMAFFGLIFRNGMSPSAREKIMPALTNMTDRISIGQKHIKTANRQDNVRVVKGLIADYFSKADVPHLGHGPGMIFDFENSLRRSRTETPRYEFKQGFLRLDKTRAIDSELLNSLLQTICGIANVGPDSDGFLYIGIADKDKDAERVQQLDGTIPMPFEHLKVVGVDREAVLLKLPMDRYVKILEQLLAASKLSEPLLTQVRTSLDVVTYKGLSVLRVRIPRQGATSFLGDDCYFRTGSATLRASGPQIAAISKLFV